MEMGFLKLNSNLNIYLVLLRFMFWTYMIKWFALNPKLGYIDVLGLQNLHIHILDIQNVLYYYSPSLIWHLKIQWKCHIIEVS